METDATTATRVFDRATAVATRRNWPVEYPVLGLLTAAYVATAELYSRRFHSPAMVGVADSLAPLALALILFPPTAAVILRFHPARRRAMPFSVAAPAAWAEVRARYLTIPRVADFLLVGGLVAVLMASFMGLKVMIPDIRPMTWDPALADFTYRLYLGHHAWRLLQPFVGFPLVTRFIDFAYFALWFPLTWGVFVWQVWRPPSFERSCYLLTYVLAWIVLGTILAILFSSGGPQFYGRLVSGPDPYAALNRYLDTVSRQTPLTAVAVREFLWNKFAHHEAAFGAGIAAMPSMHVAMAELNAMVGRRTSRGLGVVLTAFAVLTLIGSVALGPHYSVDGLFSIVAVHVIWRSCSFAIRSRQRRTAAARRLTKMVTC